ncbi:MAG: hypothetical protein V1755_15795 [Chloroflexota bacterium]
MHRRLLPRLGDFLFVCVFAGCMLLGQRMLNIDSDLGRHLVLGTHMIESLSIPVRDVLSFTMPGDPRPPYEWLAQIVFAATHRLLGIDGVILLTSSVIASAFLLAFLDGRERSGSPLIALVLAVWAAAASSLHWLTRPHVFSFLFLVIWLRLLERLRLGHRQTAWQLPLVMLVWANSHGAFVIGFLTWSAYVAGWALERRRQSTPPEVGGRLVLAGASALVASIVTPDLWNNWIAVFRNNSTYVLGRTAETMPVDFATPGSWPFVGLLVIGLLLALVNRRNITPAHGFLLLGLAALGVGMARNIPLFSLGAAPVLAAWSRHAVRHQPRITRLEQAISSIEAGLRGFIWPPLAVLIATAVIGYHVLTTHRSTYGYEPSLFPVQAADWLQHHPIEGNMFNEINWGGYLLYRLWPEQRVFIDSQSDFYGEEFTRRYEEAVLARGDWQAYLGAHDVKWAVIPASSALSVALAADHAYQRVYHDQTASIYARLASP